MQIQGFGLFEVCQRLFYIVPIGILSQKSPDRDLEGALGRPPVIKVITLTQPLIDLHNFCRHCLVSLSIKKTKIYCKNTFPATQSFPFSSCFLYNPAPCSTTSLQIASTRCAMPLPKPVVVKYFFSARPTQSCALFRLQCWPAVPQGRFQLSSTPAPMAMLLSTITHQATLSLPRQILTSPACWATWVSAFSSSTTRSTISTEW